MEEGLICALLIGEVDTAEKAKTIAKSYENCPYVNFMATKANKILATFFLPRKQRWWIEYVEKKPKQTFGLERAEVTFVDEVQRPRRLKIRLPKTLLEISPCDANCKSCPGYKECLGCPATIFHKGMQQK